MPPILVTLPYNLNGTYVPPASNPPANNPAPSNPQPSNPPPSNPQPSTPPANQPWSPSSLGAALLAWWKADAGITTGTNGRISTWADQSGHGVDLLAVNAAGDMRLASNSLNGRPQVIPNDTTAYLAAGSLAGESALNFNFNSPFSVAGVFTFRTANTNQDECIIGREDLGNGYPGWRIVTGGGDNDKLVFGLIDNLIGGKGIYVGGGPSMVIGQAYSFAFTYDGSGVAAGVKLFVGGASQGLGVGGDSLAGQSTTEGGSTVTMSNCAPGNGLNSPAQQAEYFIVNRPLTAGEIASYASYSVNRWGV